MPKKKLVLPEYTIIRDNREKEGHGWHFSSSNDCKGTEEGTLKTGDYAFKGYEELFTIERKASTSELSINVYEERFDEELKRMDKMEFPFMIFEFTWDDVAMFPIGSNIPKHLWGKLKIKAEYMMSRIIDYQVNHKTKIILAGKNGKLAAQQVFKHVWRTMYKRGIIQNE